MSTNAVVRILVFFIALPLLAAIAFLYPGYDLPVFAILVVGASAIAASEAAFFFPPQARSYAAHATTVPIIGAAIPAIGWIMQRSIGPSVASEAIVITVMGIAVITLALQVARRTDQEFVAIVPVAGMHLFLLVYPGIFAWYAIRLSFLPDASWVIVLFVLSVYLNDSLAWVFGRLFGKPRRQGDAPLVAVSPNKSRIGFIAGFLTSALVIVLFPRIIPAIPTPPLGRTILFGLVVGAVAIIGDLVESALKRSAAVKDSGQLIPGRGGLLDSIDSPLFAAPFFYYGYVLVFLS